MSDGKFFEKSAKARGGRFFRDAPGREDGNFHKAAMNSYGPGIGAATSGQMGGSFGVGSSATGGGLYGTGSGKKKPAAKKPAKTVKKVASVDTGEPLESHSHGTHRPTTDQPSGLEAGGARFLQSDNGSAPSGSPQRAVSGRVKKASDMRFMGTSFEKRSRRDPDLAGTVKSDASSAPGAAKDWGGRVARSAHRGAEGAWNTGKKVVSKGADSIASSPTASLLTLLGGTALALRGGKGALKKLVSRGGKQKSTGPLSKVKGYLTGK